MQMRRLPNSRLSPPCWNIRTPIFLTASFMAWKTTMRRSRHWCGDCGALTGKNKGVDTHRLRVSGAHRRFIALLIEDFDVRPGIDGGVNFETVGTLLPEAVQGIKARAVQITQGGTGGEHGGVHGEGVRFGGRSEGGEVVGMNSRFDGGEIAGGGRRPSDIERTGSGGVVHTIAARGFLCAAVDGQEGNAQILPVTDDGRSDAVAAVRLFTFVPFDETVPERARRAAAADAGECRKDGVGQTELPVRIERAGKGGKTGGAGSETGGGGNGIFAADGQRLRRAPADVFDEGEGAAVQGTVPSCAFAVQGDTVGICRTNGGTATVAAKRDGKTAIYRQI